MTSSVARFDIVAATGTDAVLTEAIGRLLAAGLSAWTETDRSRRRRLLAACCAPDIVYASPWGTATGLDGYSDLIGSVQSAYPGYRPVRTSAVDVHHRHARLEWAFRDDAGRSALVGLDVLTFDQKSRISTIAAFYGQIPAVRYVYEANGAHEL